MARSTKNGLCIGRARHVEKRELAESLQPATPISQEDDLRILIDLRRKELSNARSFLQAGHAQFAEFHTRMAKEFHAKIKALRGEIEGMSISEGVI
jgi:hypothetical protein